MTTADKVLDEFTDWLAHDVLAPAAQKTLADKAVQAELASAAGKAADDALGQASVQTTITRAVAVVGGAVLVGALLLAALKK